MKKTVGRKTRAVKYPVLQDDVVVYPKPILKKAAMCMEQLSTVCGVCSHMIVEDTLNKPLKSGGTPCTWTFCKDGHWEGSRTWNRLCYV